jgi:hypothetical protein
VITILILEPDHDIEESLIVQVKEVARKLGKTIRIVATDVEKECLEKIEELDSEIQLAIFNPLAPWHFPDPDMPVPPIQQQKEGNHTAGFRCVQKLREIQKHTKTPVILRGLLDLDFYTENTTMPDENTKFVEASCSDKNFHFLLLQAFEKTTG